VDENGDDGKKSVAENLSHDGNDGTSNNPPLVCSPMTIELISDIGVLYIHDQRWYEENDDC